MVLANLALRFALELVGVAALAYSGLQTSVVLGVAAPIALIVVWSVVVAPKARNPLSQRQRNLIGTILLLGAAFALAAAGQPAAGLTFGAVVLVNQALLILLGSDLAGFLPSATDRAQ